MDEKDRRILKLIQESFPLSRMPFQKIASQTHIAEDECLNRIKSLKEKGIIREISGIFESRRLGYRSTLVAMKIAPERIEKASQLISSHPGVSHNYERDHPYNIWFTLTIPAERSMDEVVKRIAELCKADSVRVFPNLRLFKIGVILDLDETENPVETRATGIAGEEQPDSIIITGEERLLVRILQRDLPLHQRPFLDLSKEADMDEMEFLSKAEDLINRGIMRRYAAVLRHRKAGFSANAMGVWAVPEERIEEVGIKMASYKAVTHCYQRPVYPDWPYNIFTMIHARTKDECEAIIKAISDETGIKEYKALYSTREFKKERVRYFSDEFEEWERRYLS